LQTWSALPITVSASTPTYDFTNTNTKAFGLNMKLVEPGIWALFSGDINQDEVIDASDNVNLANDISNSNFGYLNTDLNGDGSVDNSDLPIITNNIENSIFSNYP